MSVKYPNITVKLVGEDGNAFSILGCVTSALCSAGVSKEEIEQFRTEATSGDYYHLLGVVMEWVNEEEPEDNEDEEDYCEDCGYDIYNCHCESEDEEE